MLLLNFHFKLFLFIYMWSPSVTKHSRFPSSPMHFFISHNLSALRLLQGQRLRYSQSVAILFPQHSVINSKRNGIFCCHPAACTCLNVLQLISDSLSWQSSELHWNGAAKLDTYTQLWSHSGRWRCPARPLFSWPPLRQLHLGTGLVYFAFWGYKVIALRARGHIYTWY